MPHPDATPLSGYLVPVVALAAAGIAWMQARTARNKLKLDLFDRREAVYRAAHNAIATVTTLGRFEDADESAYILGTRGAKWLFGPEVDVYLGQVLWDKLQDLRRAQSEMELHKNSPELVVKFAETREIVKWFQDELLRLDSWFQPYLELQH